MHGICPVNNMLHCLFWRIDITRRKMRYIWAIPILLPTRLRFIERRGHMVVLELLVLLCFHPSVGQWAGQGKLVSYMSKIFTGVFRFHNLFLIILISFYSKACSECWQINGIHTIRKLCLVKNAFWLVTSPFRYILCRTQTIRTLSRNEKSRQKVEAYLRHILKHCLSLS